jgi:ATP-dependent helicase/nuclease subunit B
MEPLRTFVRAVRATEGVDGEAMAEATRALWKELGVEGRLEAWDAEGEGALRHATVFREVSEWLDEAARAFKGHPMGATEWLPVVESAWNGLTAGAVPPTLDQVLIGAVDRSRNPDLTWVVLPGWVEGGFPASAPSQGLLTGSELEALEESAEVGLGPTPLDRVHHEHFYGYVALTRARREVVVTWASEGLGGETHVASPLVRRWLHDVAMEEGAAVLSPGAKRLPAPVSMPSEATGCERLSPGVAKAFWRGRIETSASGLEKMASCRFAFFASQVLRLRERNEKTADAREEGSWAHGLLSEFHESLRKEGLPWRAVSADEGVARLRAIAAEMRRAEGIDRAGGAVEFAWARAEGHAVEWLRHWLSVLAEWPGDPEWVEAAFGEGMGWGLMEWPVDGGGTLALRGRVDRVDVLGKDARGRPRIWVEDYKRGQRRFKIERVEAGLDLQLPLYLDVASRATGGVPAGMTYAALRPERSRSRHRDEPPESNAHEHRGRFAWELVREAAGKEPPWERLPFKLKLKKDGTPSSYSDGVGLDELKGVVATAVATSVALAAGMLAGDVAVAPVPDGNQLPCETCAHRGVCRVGAGW